MKKRLLATLLIFVLAFNSTACSLGSIKNKAERIVDVIKEDDEDLDLTIREKDENTEETKVEEETTTEVKEQQEIEEDTDTENESSSSLNDAALTNDSVWATSEKDFSSGITNIKYQSDIPDNFNLNAYCTFKDLCDEVEEATDNFDINVFKHVLSMYYVSEDSYEELMKNQNDSLLAIQLADLAALSWVISDLNGYTNEYSIDANSYSLIYNIESTTLGSFKLRLKLSSNTLSLIREDGSETDYSTDYFSDDTITLLIVLMTDALCIEMDYDENNENTSEYSSESTQSSSTDNQIDITGTMESQITLLDSNTIAEAKKAVENYYGSTVIGSNIKIAFNGSELGDIFLENGAQCMYCTLADGYSSIYDVSNGTFETFWTNQ